MICGYKYMCTVQTVDNSANNVTQFFNGLANGIKGLVFGGSFITYGVDVVMINIHNAVNIQQQEEY